MKTNRRKRGILFLVVGVVLLFIAGGWYLANVQQDQNAGRAKTALLEELNQQMANLPMDSEQNADKETDVVIDGDAFCGKVVIDKIGVELPVYQNWDYEKLKKAPCRYAGSISTGDMIVAGHNYRSHFGDLRVLEVNDTVLFVDTDGVVHTYVVKELTVLDGTAVDDMTLGDWDFTLFTCTKGGKQRVTVRCDEMLLVE